jgi:ABC-type transporter Mla MlaB component
VRAHGSLTDVPDSGDADHVCWVYEDDETFNRAVGVFLAGGLARGERVLCVGERVIDGLREVRLPAHDVTGLIAAGTLETQTLAEAYEAAGPFLPANQLAYYDAATRRAVDAGYTGLRVIAEVSSLAADPATRPALVRWEHVADEFSARGTGFSAMCAYRGDLAREALNDVATVHPLVHAPGAVPSFRVFFEDDRLLLAGSVDTFSADRLARVLASSPVDPGGAVLDLSLTEFVDVSACRVLARWARDLQARSLHVEMRDASPLFRRMWRILALDDLVPVTFAGAAA